MSKKIRTIFIGTPDFGIPALNALVDSSDFEVIAVITQPDKKQGREQILTAPAMKVAAEKFGIPVFQPEKINKFVDEIKKINPELIIVAAYAQIISQALLVIPKFGCVNIHGSLLPKYRGAACIQGAILNGEKETGITIMKMNAGLDTGDIIEKFSLPILDNDTTETLFDKLSQLGGEIIVPTLLKFIDNKIIPQKQNDAEASYVKMIKKEDGKIDWNKRAEEIERLVRAMTSWPGAYSELRINNEEPCLPAGRLRIIKILKVEHTVIKSVDKKIGEVFLHDGRIAVQCGQDALVILHLQMAGKKPLSCEEFLRGYKDIVGMIFV